MATDPLARLRQAIANLPEVEEVEAWETPTFRVRNKMFAMYAGKRDGAKIRMGVWIKSTITNQELMVQNDPERYFVPPYVGQSGWVGVFLDKRVAWNDVEEMLLEAYTLVAPKRLASKLKH